MRRIHRGHFPSTVPARGQNLSVLAAQTSLWHDSQRTEASQDFYLFFVYKTCPSGQVLAISERRTKFWLPSLAAFVKVNAACKPPRRTLNFPPSSRHFR